VGFKANYRFFLRLYELGYDFVGSYGEPPAPDPNGLPAVEAFRAIDERGEVAPCAEPLELRKALTGSRSLNAQIKMWAKGLASCDLFVCELQEYLASISAPAWVMKSVQHQAYKFGWLSPAYADEMTVLYTSIRSV